VNTVIYRSLKAFGFVVDEEGSEFVTLNRKVVGSDRSVCRVHWKCTFTAAPITGQDKCNCVFSIIFRRFAHCTRRRTVSTVERRSAGTKWLCYVASLVGRIISGFIISSEANRTAKNHAAKGRPPPTRRHNPQHKYIPSFSAYTKERLFLRCDRDGRLHSPDNVIRLACNNPAETLEQRRSAKQPVDARGGE